MIQVYKSGNSNYEWNGDITLAPLSCIFEIELNGICQIELSHEYDDMGRWEYLQNDNVIACPTPYSEKQLFRIYDRVKEEDSITVYARHIFFDNLTNVLLDARPIGKNGKEALEIILAGTGYTAHSDITTVNTAYYVRMNVVAAIAGDDDNSFINRWGGERLYNNYDVYIMRELGSDKGVRAEFGHNLDGIQEDSSIEEVLTRIIPVAYNGYILAGSSPWVDSPNIREYEKVRTGVVEFGEIKLQEDCNEGEEGYTDITTLRAALVEACNNQFELGIDAPKVNYVVNLIELSETEEYRKYKQLETVEIGDTITCRHKKIKIDVKARCIRIKWNCITKQNEEVELGNFLQSYFDKTTSNIQQATAAIEGTVTQVLAAKQIAAEAATQAIKSEVAAQAAATTASGAAITATNQTAAAKSQAEIAANKAIEAASKVTDASNQVKLATAAAEAAVAEKVAAGEYATQAASQANLATGEADRAQTQATAASEYATAANNQAEAADTARAEAVIAKEATQAAQAETVTAQEKAEIAATTATNQALLATNKATEINIKTKEVQVAADKTATNAKATKNYYELTKELYENASIATGGINETWLELSYINNCYLSK
ncbi:MAG: phage tail spike protein [Lachnotalea sp.]